MLLEKKQTRAILVLSMGLSALLIALVVLRYEALSSNFWDLGIFLSAHTNIDKEWQRAFYGHVHPLMLVWGGAYHALPVGLAPFVIVVTQALILLGSAAAIWRFYGPLPGFAMLLYYPLWANALFDFHYDHLVIPLLIWFFVACERYRFYWAAVAAALLVLVKEPFALQTLACGLYMGWLVHKLRGQGYTFQLLILGALLVLWGGFWFYGATHWVLPYFTDGSRGGVDASAFNWLGNSLSKMLWTLLSRPDVVVAEILGTPGKLIYFTVIFGLLAFIPLLRPAALIVALPLFAIAMLSHGQPNYYSYAYHYTAGLIIPVMVAFRDGLPSARGWFASIWIWGVRVLPRYNSLLNRLGLSKVNHPDRIFTIILAVWLVAGHWAFASSPIARLFWSEKVWSYNWRAYVPTERIAMIKEALLTHVPADPATVVTTQNTLNWGHLAHRHVYLSFPMGVGEPHPVVDWSNRDLAGLWHFILHDIKPPTIVQHRYADFVVLDLKRPYFIVDKGCEWLYGACRDANMERQFLDAVDLARALYDPVFEEDGFMILRRRTDAGSDT